MNDVTNNTAGEINRLHQLATQKANEAINYARHAGLLLLEMKKKLPHGSFGPWIEANLQVSVRQAQRYLAVASGKQVAVRELTGKNGTMSLLSADHTQSEGIWTNGRWKPERGCIYLFNDESGSVYWITPSSHQTPHFHICKHYGGKRMPVKGFYPSYTVFGDVDDPDFTSDFYVGTRYPLFLELGVDGVLKSYGLKDIKKSLLKGYRTNHRFDRPLGEPAVENQYWEEDVADQLEGSSSQHS